MAAASSNGRAIAGSFGKRLTSQLWSEKQCDFAMLLSSRRASHSGSHYDKEIEEQVNPVEVPDFVIGTQSDKYWGPDPATGVFGPDDPKADDVAKSGGRDRGRSEPPEFGHRSPSALDETVRFRQFDVDDIDLDDQK